MTQGHDKETTSIQKESVVLKKYLTTYTANLLFKLELKTDRTN
jgi:hypothetical protein